nr:TetR/AcrR family transcriptional regulator C-terminal ligand-binding domain-containing protein [Streptomyces hydrogenans]
MPPHADRGGRLRPLERAPKQLLGRLLERGIARGEVCPEALDGLVLDVIPAMMMRRSKMCGSEWINDEVAEVIDRNMVPLVRSSPS